MRHGVKSLREFWRRAECAPGRTQDERGPPKAMAVAWFFAPEIGRIPFRVSRKMATLRSRSHHHARNASQAGASPVDNRADAVSLAPWSITPTSA